MKLTRLSLALASICFLSNSYAMQNNGTKQVSENSLDNLLEAKRLVGEAEGILACMNVMVVLAPFETLEGKVNYINKEKGKATVFAYQAIPFVKAVKNHSNKDLHTIEAMKMFKKIEIIIK